MVLIALKWLGAAHEVEKAATVGLDDVLVQTVDLGLIKDILDYNL